MRSQSYITNNLAVYLRVLLCIFALGLTDFAQKIAVITPETNRVTNEISARFAERFKALDSDLVGNVVKNAALPNLFNLTTIESQTLGSAIGCDFFLLIKADGLRRSSFTKPVYYEAFVTVFLVSTRSGRLVFWTLKSFEAQSQDVADKQLSDNTDQLIDQISDEMKRVNDAETTEASIPKIEELPAENTPEANNFSPPLPYRRLLPPYKRIANLYGIAASVEATVDLNELGEVTRLEITRWGGYELDQAVIATIKKMQWRPAIRDGKPMPIRVLLRYNFKRIEKDE